MKNAIFALALVGLAFGCKSNQNTAVADPAKANMPKAECSMNKECAGMSKEGCTAEQKAACEGKKSCCQKTDAPQN